MRIYVLDLYMSIYYECAFDTELQTNDDYRLSITDYMTDKNCA